MCKGGECCDACSRNTFPTFATGAETDLETFPELEKFSFNELEVASSSTILNFVRLVERVSLLSLTHTFHLTHAPPHMTLTRPSHLDRSRATISGIRCVRSGRTSTNC